MDNEHSSDLLLVGGLALAAAVDIALVAVALPLLLGPLTVPVYGLGVLATVGWAIASA